MKSPKSLLIISLLVLSVVLTAILAACGGNQLEKIVEELNSDEAMHAELEGLYKVHAETRGDSVIAVIFRAEMEELATPEVSQIVSDEAASEFRAAVDEMRNAGITDPEIILEFLDMSGAVIFVRQIS